MNFFIPGSYSTGSSSALVFERRKGNNNIAESNIIVDFAIVLPFTLIDQAFPHPFISPVSRRCVPNPHSTWHMAVIIVYSSKLASPKNQSQKGAGGTFLHSGLNRKTKEKRFRAVTIVLWATTTYPSPNF